LQLEYPPNQNLL